MEQITTPALIGSQGISRGGSSSEQLRRPCPQRATINVSVAPLECPHPPHGTPPFLLQTPPSQRASTAAAVAVAVAPFMLPPALTGNESHMRTGLNGSPVDDDQLYSLSDSDTPNFEFVLATPNEIGMDSKESSFSVDNNEAAEDEDDSIGFVVSSPQSQWHVSGKDARNPLEASRFCFRPVHHHREEEDENYHPHLEEENQVTDWLGEGGSRIMQEAFFSSSPAPPPLPQRLNPPSIDPLHKVPSNFRLQPRYNAGRAKHFLFY